MDQDTLFVNAFNYVMKTEVGPFWDPTDQDVIDGNIDTKQQRQKVGYVNIPQDRGGETKYGIAQNSNPNINVRTLNLQQAMNFYQSEYWIKGYCNMMPESTNLLNFDGCINHGVKRACRFFQQAVNVNDDGIIGPASLAAFQAMPQTNVINKICDIRIQFYKSIVANNPSQSIFINGWMRRINTIRAYTLSLIN